MTIDVPARPSRASVITTITAIVATAVVTASVARRLRAARQAPGHVSPAEAPTAPPPPAIEHEPVLGYVSVIDGSVAADHDRAAVAIAEACEETGRKLVAVVCDSARGRPLERPGLMHALGQIADGEARGLVVSDLLAFSRSPHELATLGAWFRDAGATLVALDLGFDTATPGGRQAAAALIALGDDKTHANGRPEGESAPGHKRPGPRARMPRVKANGG